MEVEVAVHVHVKGEGHVHVHVQFMCMCMCSVCMYPGCVGSDARERGHAARAEAPREHSGASILEQHRRVGGGFLAIPVEAILILVAIREHNHHPASTRPGCS